MDSFIVFEKVRIDEKVYKAAYYFKIGAKVT